ncbi:MAG: universal stress protein [Erythrobacter sp.]
MPAQKIAVATDFSARADRAIDRAKQLHEDLGGTLKCIHATNLPSDDPPDLVDLRKQMQRATGLEESEGTVEFVFPSGMPPTAIANETMGDDVALLVIGPARYNSLGDFFLGTAVDYVLRNTPKPVLIAKKRPRAPYRQIVAGTDFSAGSAKAILTAARLFPEADIRIVHGWHMPFQGFQKDAYVAEEIVTTQKASMRAFVADLVERDPRLEQAITDVVKGGAIEAVRQGLEAEPDALVVVGSHGAGGFEQATIGSVTSDLLRVIDADTLVVSTKGVE